jgi:paraquat-inducible protein A
MKILNNSMIKGVDVGLAGCSTCQLVVRLTSNNQYCPRCNTRLHFRKINSLNRTWAFLISALIMYVPANLEPVMRTSYLGSESADTILSGVVYFLHHGDWPLALIIFSASILIPLVKMMVLAYLLISVHRRSTIRKHERTRLYRLTELIGRWSMVDVFVVALMAALVQMGTLATIIPGVGAVAFSSVVILTMLAAMAFDPRLIWDQQGDLVDE